MNWDEMGGRWKSVRGKVREQWGKLTDDDLDQIAGKRDQLVGSIQRRYGTAKEEVEKQVKQWEDRFDSSNQNDDSSELMERNASRTGSTQRSGMGGSQSGGSQSAGSRGGAANSGDRDFATGGGSSRERQTSGPGSPGDRESSGQGGQPGGKGGQSNPGGSREPFGR